MVDRGFGIQVEEKYGELVSEDEFSLDWWSEADDVDFKLNDDPVTRSGGSRMNKRARAGVMKPTGSTTADADLQRLIWYMYGYLDNYKYTEATKGTVNTHEFWGGEGKALPSFRGIAVYDMLKKYLYGLLVDGLKFEVGSENVSISADWIYKTEKAGIIDGKTVTFTRPDDLTDDIFLMFYDFSIKLNNTPLTGVSTAFSFEGKNNHNVDSTIGLGSRYPQKRALAVKRENSLSLTTTLTSETVRSILDAQYGEVDAVQPTECKLLQIPLEVTVALCENSNISMTILFPRCTVRVEYNMSGADVIEATLNLETLGSDKVTLHDGESVATDMYVKILSEQGDISGKK